MEKLVFSVDTSLSIRKLGSVYIILKFIYTTFPLNDAVFWIFPWLSSKSKSIAGRFDLSELSWSMLALKSPVSIICRSINDFASGLTIMITMPIPMRAEKPFFLMNFQNLFSGGFSFIISLWFSTTFLTCYKLLSKNRPSAGPRRFFPTIFPSGSIIKDAGIAVML